MGKRTKLHLASNLSFGTDVITEVINIIAKRGSGKTYTGTKLAEEMLAIGAQTVVVDPVGNWYGLRLGADGKADGGMDITVLGGRNGDIPLEHTAGKLVAKTLVETGMSAILDLSLFSKSKQRRFVTEFSEALLEFRQRDPGAMHIFWEEAYRFMPQKIAKGSKSEMLEATEELITMGRNFGIGGTVICQRAAIVSKTVLSQASIFIAMNTNAPGDRKVIEEWMDHRNFNVSVGQLHKLKKGEARVWWPEEFGCREVKIDKKKTYNASATPQFGEKTRKRKLKPVDLESLQEAMAETIEKMKGEDPRLLKRRIADLEKELHDALSQPSEVKVEVKEVKVLGDKAIDDLVKAAQKIDGHLAELHDTSERIRSSIRDAVALKEQAKVSLPKTIVRRMATPIREIGKNGVKQALGRIICDTEPLTNPVSIGKGGAYRMLQALACVSPQGLTKKQVCLASEMKPKSGTTSNYWGTLNKLGLIRADGGKQYITEEGEEYLGGDIPAELSTPSVRIEYWCSKLTGRSKDILRLLFESPEEGFTKREIGESLDLSLNSGTFSNYLGALTSNSLAVKSCGQYQLNPDLLV